MSKSKKTYTHAAKLLAAKFKTIELEDYSALVGIPSERLTEFAEGEALPTLDQVGILAKTLKIKEDKLIEAVMSDLARPAINVKEAPKPQPSGSPRPAKRW